MEILDKLAENEEHISRLYRVYAEIMPAHKEFWSKLADEEIEHASWIRNFAEGVEGGTLAIDEKRFPRNALQTYSQYLDGSIDRAARKGVDVMGAFTTAIYIEESLVELKFFEVIDSGSEEFDDVLLHLKKDTIEHNKRIKEYWSKIKDTARGN